MGGRGAGIKLTSSGRLMGVKDSGKSSFGTTALGNTDGQTIDSLADAIKDKYKDRNTVVAIADDDGNILGAARGDDGKVSMTSAMRAEMDGNNVVVYPNRVSYTDAQRAEMEADEEAYKGVERALNRFRQADLEIARLEELQDRTQAQLANYEDRAPLNAWLKSSGVPQEVKNKIIALQTERDDYDHAWRLAWRRKRAAMEDYQQRADEYEGTKKPGRIKNLYTSFVKRDKKGRPLRDADGSIAVDNDAAEKLLPAHSTKADETGYIGGGPNLTHINLLSTNMRGISSVGPEGRYDVRVPSSMSREDILKMQRDMGQLWDSDSDAATSFRVERNKIDIDTMNEGIANGWSIQQRRAVSFNRQMNLIWEKQKQIFDSYGIEATFTPNPNYSPVY